MSDKIIESLAAARPAQFHPGSAIDPATRERELSAAFSAPTRSAHRHRRACRPDRLPLAVFAAALSIVLVATGVWLAHPLLSGPAGGHGKGKVHNSPHPTKTPVHPRSKNLLSAPVAKPPPVTQAQAGMPAYYVITEDNSSVVEVRSTTTGELLSEVNSASERRHEAGQDRRRPPRPVRARALAVPQTKFYLLKVSDDGHSAQLTALSVPPAANDFVTVVATEPRRQEAGVRRPAQQPARHRHARADRGRDAGHRRGPDLDQRHPARLASPALLDRSWP